MIMVRRMNQADGPVFFADIDPIIGLQLANDVAVAGQVRAIDLRRPDHDGNAAIPGNDDGPVAQCVRACLETAEGAGEECPDTPYR